MSTHQLISPVKHIKEHLKIVRFGMKTSSHDPWKKITGIFKLGKKINPRQLLNEKGFNHA